MSIFVRKYTYISIGKNWGRINMSTGLIGKLLGTASGSVTQVQHKPQLHSVTTPSYKTSSYASIPYERAPQVLDTVPTKGLLPGYSTPEKVWIA